MSKASRYTTLAYRYAAKFPVLTYVSTQVNFWMVANIFLVSIMHLHLRAISAATKIPVPVSFGPMLLVAIILGVSNGISLGLAGYYLDRKFFRKRSLGQVILLKTLTSLSVLILLLAFFRYVLFDLLISPSFFASAITLNEASFRPLLCLLLIYYFFMSLVISFINQINKKYGPGVLIPLLLGQYSNPQEEERIFMFMDLKSSTSVAEALGHLRYSSFIRDCFLDINQVLYPFRAQVYQYVGDEIVVTWPEREGLKNHFCIRFYFACKKMFRDRAEHYLTNYGFLPDFKASVHAGTVTAVEIGEYKRDIAYHGDTLNTAARIQSVCNEYQRSFLVSEYLFNKVGLHPDMTTEPLGMILLRGKTKKVGVLSVDWVNT